MTYCTDVESVVGSVLVLTDVEAVVDGAVYGTEATSVRRGINLGPVSYLAVGVAWSYVLDMG